MGQLTTHVLDTCLGKPGSAIELTLFRVIQGTREALAERVTNADGRCDEPLLTGAEFVTGEYEIHFAIGPYLMRTGQRSSHETTHAFLDTVVIRFGISAAEEHYHVPLLVSPFAYSTYRGS